MTRLEALEKVAEAARGVFLRHDDMAQKRWRYGVLSDALSAFDALPQPPPPGETVEVRAVVYRDDEDGCLVVSGWQKLDGSWTWPGDGDQGPHIATITARVPLPTIPTITAIVEP